MSRNDNISMSVIRRLPRYYRFLSELNEQNIDKISSTKLAEIMNVTASQVRQDLNCFGGFGQQGYGYSVSQLKEEIQNILGLNNDYKAILIGAGNLGKAVAKHMNFEKLGFELIACFDCNEEKVGKKLNNLTIMHDSLLDDFCQNNKINTAFCAYREYVWKMYLISCMVTASRTIGISVTMTLRENITIHLWRMSTSVTAL